MLHPASLSRIKPNHAKPDSRVGGTGLTAAGRAAKVAQGQDRTKRWVWMSRQGNGRAVECAPFPHDPAAVRVGVTILRARCAERSAARHTALVSRDTPW